jgi:hypothetical protein
MVCTTGKKRAFGRHSSIWECNIKISEVATSVNIEMVFFWNVIHGYQRFFYPED